jgi:hypothetical protein
MLQVRHHLTYSHTHTRHGAQGTLDGASKATLENEFGTANADDVIKEILEKGSVQETEVCLALSLPLSLRTFRACSLLYTAFLPTQTSAC